MEMRRRRATGTPDLSEWLPGGHGLPKGNAHRSPAEVEVEGARSAGVGQLDEIRLLEKPQETAGDAPVELPVVDRCHLAGGGREDRESAIHPTEVGQVQIGSPVAVIGLPAALIVAHPGPWTPVHVVVDDPVASRGPAERQDKADGRDGRGFGALPVAAGGERRDREDRGRSRVAPVRKALSQGAPSAVRDPPLLRSLSGWSRGGFGCGSGGGLPRSPEKPASSHPGR